VTLRARWVTLRARWVTLRARWVTLRARWVTLRARWVTLRACWVVFRLHGAPPPALPPRRRAGAGGARTPHRRLSHSLTLCLYTSPGANGRCHIALGSAKTHTMVHTVFSERSSKLNQAFFDGSLHRTRSVRVRFATWTPCAWPWRRTPPPASPQGPLSLTHTLLTLTNSHTHSVRVRCATWTPCAWPWRRTPPPASPPPPPVVTTTATHHPPASCCATRRCGATRSSRSCRRRCGDHPLLALASLSLLLSLPLGALVVNLPLPLSQVAHRRMQLLRLVRDARSPVRLRVPR
jgi:hypothetical protein